MPIGCAANRSRRCRAQHPADGSSSLETLLQPGVYRVRNRIKHFRRLATRYEKHAANFLAILKRAAVHLWLRHNESVI